MQVGFALAVWAHVRIWSWFTRCGPSSHGLTVLVTKPKRPERAYARTVKFSSPLLEQMGLINDPQHSCIKPGMNVIQKIVDLHNPQPWMRVGWQLWCRQSENNAQTILTMFRTDVWLCPWAFRSLGEKGRGEKEREEICPNSPNKRKCLFRNDFKWLKQRKGVIWGAEQVFFLSPGVMMSNISDRRKIMSGFYLGGCEHQCRCINKKLQRLGAEMLQTCVPSPTAFLIHLSPSSHIRIHLLFPYQLQCFGEKKNVWVCRRRVSAPVMGSASGPFSRQWGIIRKGGSDATRVWSVTLIGEGIWEWGSVYSHRVW